MPIYVRDLPELIATARMLVAGVDAEGRPFPTYTIPPATPRGLPLQLTAHTDTWFIAVEGHALNDVMSGFMDYLRAEQLKLGEQEFSSVKRAIVAREARAPLPVAAEFNGDDSITYYINGLEKFTWVPMTLDEAMEREVDAMNNLTTVDVCPTVPLSTIVLHPRAQILGPQLSFIPLETLCGLPPNPTCEALRKAGFIVNANHWVEHNRSAFVANGKLRFTLTEHCCPYVAQSVFSFLIPSQQIAAEKLVCSECSTLLGDIVFKRSRIEKLRCWHCAHAYENAGTAIRASMSEREHYALDPTFAPLALLVGEPARRGGDGAILLPGIKVCLTGCYGYKAPDGYTTIYGIRSLM